MVEINKKLEKPELDESQVFLEILREKIKEKSSRKKKVASKSLKKPKPA